ncbi:DUF499 domain-containing protein [Rhodococcus qingshengii]|uniref:DUF499 domain-containing protein n=1 Tax=Rhodococcus qingshengii TaxID=334542 RepID=UPI001ADFA8CA|nr:DUF499 domain-containing protein [Rhodococcus qingshengii]
MASDVTPWWKALQIRKEIISASGQIDDVQMSLFNAVYGTEATKAPYADADYYGSITYPAARLVDLLAEIAIRLGGGGQDYTKAHALTRLDQGMGGGKSHACIGAYHLAAHPTALMRTELGVAVAAAAAQKIGRPLPEDLNNPHVVVLACDSMTPFAPDKALDGPATTLYERFLWRLVSKDYALYERYQGYWSDKSKIGDAIRAVGRPVLIVIDEILDYIGNGLDGSDKPQLVAQDQAFLRALLDVVNDVPNTAMLLVMIASDSDSTALTAEAQARRADLNSLLERNGTPAVVTEVADFAEILRRRLFQQQPAAEVLTATAGLYAAAMADKAWAKNVWEATAAEWRKDWDNQVASCYPFHPMLIGIARNEWAQVTGFQRVRSTIRIFAATVYALQQRGLAGEWVPALIGPGDLPLSDNTVREAILGSGLVEDDKTSANYRSLAENEIVNARREGGIARLQDVERAKDPQMWNQTNPYASERAATFIFLASIVGTLRPGRGRGASAPEVKAATGVPNTLYTVTDADLVVSELVGQDGGLSAVETIAGHGNNKPQRYFLSTKLTHRMLVNNIKRTITDAERDEAIATFAEKISTSGPFGEKKFIRADFTRSATDVLATAGIDDGHSNRIIVLDPAQFSLRNGMEKETVAALRMAMGLGAGMPVQWASSAVYAVVNTQRRGQARNLAKEFLAREKALAAPEVQADEDLRQTGMSELDDARRQLDKAIRRAYQHVVFLAQPETDGERRFDELTFDADNLSALDGTVVWKALADKDKTFDKGQLTVKALLHNLRASDYGRSLAEIRGAFYNAPRLPLLHGGDGDLKEAIFDAVSQGRLRIVDGTGSSVAVTGPGQVNLSSAGLSLRLPECPVCGKEEDEHQCKAEAEKDGVEPSVAGDSNAPQDARTAPGSPPSASGAAAKGVGIPAVTSSSSPAVEAEQDAQPEKVLAVSFVGNLLGDPEAAEKYGILFKVLRLACEESDVTYLQGKLDLVLSADSAAKVAAAAAAIGLNPTIRDQ